MVERWYGRFNFAFQFSIGRKLINVEIGYLFSCLWYKQSQFLHAFLDFVSSQFFHTLFLLPSFCLLRRPVRFMQCKVLKFARAITFRHAFLKMRLKPSYICLTFANTLSISTSSSILEYQPLYIKLSMY